MPYTHKHGISRDSGNQVERPDELKKTTSLKIVWNYANQKYFFKKEEKR